MSRPWTLCCAIVLFGLGFDMTLALPWAAHRILPSMGGTHLTWSMVLLVWTLSMFGGVLLAKLFQLAGQFGVLSLLALLVAAAAWNFAGIPFEARAEAWGHFPFVTSLSALVNIIGPQQLAVWTAVWSLLAGSSRDRMKPGSPFRLLWIVCLGGVAGAFVYGVAESKAAADEVRMFWKGLFLASAPLVIGLRLWSMRIVPTIKPIDSSKIPNLALGAIGSWRYRVFWMLAGIGPFGLLAAQTRFVTEDICPTTLFWIVPLGMFLLAWAQAISRPDDWSSSANRVWTVVSVVGHAGILLVALIVFLLNDRNPAPCAAFLVGWCLLTPTASLRFVQPLAAMIVLACVTGWGMFNFTTMVMQWIGVYLTIRAVLLELHRSRPDDDESLGYHGWLAAGAVVGVSFVAEWGRFFLPRASLEYALLIAWIAAFGASWLRNGLADLVMFNLVAIAKRTERLRHRLAIWFDAGVGIIAAIAAFGGVWLGGELARRVFNFIIFGNWRFELIALAPALLVCVVVIARPTRFAFACAGLALGYFLLRLDSFSSPIHRERTSFTDLRVRQEDKNGVRLRNLMDGSTHHGSELQGDAAQRRIATTYFHPNGPVGQVMKRFRWFPRSPQAASDVRIVSALVGHGAGAHSLPTGMLAESWSEPPIAVLGMSCGSMATYARPFQRVDFYELDPGVAALSDSGERLFESVADAKARGAVVRILIGDQRQSLREEKPQGYYAAIFVNVFHSDAVPSHFLTSQCLKEMFEVVQEGGVICFHTSNRWVDIPPVLAGLGICVTAVNRDGFADFEPKGEDLFRSTSEWVVLARNERALFQWRLPRFFPQFGPLPRAVPRDAQGFSLARLRDPTWAAFFDLIQVWICFACVCLAGVRALGWALAASRMDPSAEGETSSSRS